MKRETSAAERLLMLVGVVLTVGWGAFLLWVILSYRGSTLASTWAARVVMVVVAGGLTSAVIVLVRLGWRRAVSRPFPKGRTSPWIARQPFWAQALFFWVVTTWPFLGALILADVRDHQGLPHGLLLSGLPLSIVGSCCLALMFRVMWRRQADNSERRKQRRAG